MPIGLYILGMDTLNVFDQTDSPQHPFNIQQRGLRHCLSSGDGQCESLTSGMSDGSDSRAFLCGLVFFFGSGIAGLGSDVGPKEVAPDTH